MTVMHDFYEPRVTPPVASDFYRHPYGGIGRDIFVSREGFARYFDKDVEEIDALPENMKITQVQPAYNSREHVEMLGYKLVGRRTEYMITFVDYRRAARYRFLEREVDRICNDFGRAVKEATDGFTRFARALSGS